MASWKKPRMIWSAISEKQTKNLCLKPSRFIRKCSWITPVIRDVRHKMSPIFNNSSSRWSKMRKIHQRGRKLSWKITSEKSKSRKNCRKNFPLSWTARKIYASSFRLISYLLRTSCLIRRDSWQTSEKKWSNQRLNMTSLLLKMASCSLITTQSSDFVRKFEQWSKPCLEI